MPHPRREEGIVDVTRPGEPAPKPFEGFDLDKIALSDEWLLELVFKAHGLDPKSQTERQQLRRIYSKKLRRPQGGRPPDDLALTLEMNKAGVTDDDTAPKAADKIIACRRKQRDSKENLVQKVRRHRRQGRAVVEGWLKLGG